MNKYQVVIEIANEEHLFNVEANTTAQAHKYAEIEAENQGLDLNGARVTVYQG